MKTNIVWRIERKAHVLANNTEWTGLNITIGYYGVDAVQVGS
jgi:hypothetical protein